MATMDHHKKLLSALIELQMTGNELFGQLVVDHKDSNSVIVEEACAQVLSKQSINFNKVPSFKYPCNEQKVYHSKIPPTVNRKIDIQQLDTTFRYDLMLFLGGFPVSKPKNHNEKVRCIGACSKICKRKDYCCDQCHMCKTCNKLLPYQQQCAVYKLGVGLHQEKILRNLFSHLTPKILEDFLNGNGTFPDFPAAKDWNDLCNEFYSAMSYICEYMSDRQNFSNPNVNILAGNEKVDRLSKLELILNEDTRIQTDLNLVFNLKQILAEEKKQQLLDMDGMFNDYITDRLNEMEDSMTDQHNEVTLKLETLKTDILASQDVIRDKIDDFTMNQDTIRAMLVEIQKKISVLNARNGKESEQESAQEEDNEEIWSQRGWRNICGGVVIWLDDGHEEVEFVSCKKTPSQLPIFTIKQKLHVSNILKDPYFETDLSLLKIENMENGTYQIDVKDTSGVIIKSVMVECNEVNHPVHNIGNVGIAVPSSDVKKFWEDVAKQLKQSTPDEHEISWVSKGASVTTKNLKEFEELGKQYLEQNFPDLGQTLCFLPPHQVDDETLKEISEKLVALLKIKYIDRSKRKVILVSPNFAYHLGLIKNNTSSMNEKTMLDEHCLSLFVEEESLILVVRIALDSQQIEAAIRQCQKEILNMIKSHGSKLVTERIGIVGVIACPTIIRKQLNENLPFHFSYQTEFYNNLFLCKDEFGKESLRTWWDAAISNLHKQFNMGISNINHDFFSTIIGQHMASMASSKDGFPTLIGESHEKLQSLIMNRYQIDAIYSKSKIKLISAPFGAGKTVVGQKILKELSNEIQNSQDPGLLCYISCNPYSMVDVSVETSMRNIDRDKVTFLCGSLHVLYREHVSKDLSTVSLDALIKTLADRCQKTHVVVDEINESVMTKEVATNINDLLNKTDSQCRITFIRQSIKKDRNYKLENQTHSLEKDHFDIIQGLKLYELPKVMRLTITNQALVDIAQKIVTKQPIEVPLPRKQSKTSLSDTSSLLEASNKVDDRDFVIEKYDDSLSADSMIVDPSLDKIIQESSLASTNDIDLSLKILSKSKVNANTGHSIITEFQCISGEMGHAIDHSKPEIIYFTQPISLNNINDAKLLYYVSNACCFKHDNPVFIATSIESAKMFYFMTKACNKQPLLYIPYLEQRIPSSKEKQDIVSKMRESLSVLITDHRSFLGMESKSVTTFADPSESQNSLIETISRCTSWLQIFVPHHGRSNERGTLSQILQAWKHLSVTKNLRVDINSKHNEICVKENDDIIISTKSEDFLMLDISHFLPRDEEFQVNALEENTWRFIESTVAAFQTINLTSPPPTTAPLTTNERKFMYEQNQNIKNPVEINLLYSQSRDGILTGAYPCPLEEAAKFAALNIQIQYEDYDEIKYRSGQIELKDVLPKEYLKRKDVEKSVKEEHKLLMKMDILDAKYKYIQLCQNLPTYGFTFFSVKEKMKGITKMVPRLLGINKESILRVDEKTKMVLMTWPLTQVRRWAASSKSFTLDFGDYSDGYYSVQTNESDQISNLISGYVDIIFKRRKDMKLVDDGED